MLRQGNTLATLNQQILKSEPAMTIDVKDAAKIVSQFNKFLTGLGFSLYDVYDIKLLPFDKDDIYSAAFLAYREVPTDKLRESIETTIQCLPSFQADAADNPLCQTEKRRLLELVYDEIGGGKEQKDLSSGDLDLLAQAIEGAGFSEEQISDFEMIVESTEQERAWLNEQLDVLDRSLK